MGFAPSIDILIVGRFIIGFGVGIASMISAIYLAECSPIKIRVGVVALNILATTFGQVIAYLVAILIGPNWRMMLLLAGVPSTIQFFLMLALPETPRFLAKQ